MESSKTWIRFPSSYTQMKPIQWCWSHLWQPGTSEIDHGSWMRTGVPWIGHLHVGRPSLFSHFVSQLTGMTLRSDAQYIMPAGQNLGLVSVRWKWHFLRSSSHRRCRRRGSRFGCATKTLESNTAWISMCHGDVAWSSHFWMLQIAGNFVCWAYPPNRPWHYLLCRCYCIYDSEVWKALRVLPQHTLAVANSHRRFPSCVGLIQ